MHFRRHRTCCTKDTKGYGPQQSAMDMAWEMVTGSHQGLLSIGQHATQRYLGLDRGGQGQLRKDWSAVWNARHRPVSQLTSSRAELLFIAPGRGNQSTVWESSSGIRFNPGLGLYTGQAGSPVFSGKY
uniref:(northern house mosquito) hypothetical protein n=1 Tax=Culex pipiens TaxID=7175 RepID=A0A8D8IFX4_CULPI